MRDIHCHILPEVDEGSESMTESLMMLSAAQQAGISTVVCTPHCRNPYFDFQKMWQAYLMLKRHASVLPDAPQLVMGFEVHFHKLKELGMDSAIQLGNGYGEFLLEMPKGGLPIDWQVVVHNLQQKGFHVVIAHPERYAEVQDDIRIARRFVEAGCSLQVSANCIQGGLRDARRKCAKQLFEGGLVSHIASEARSVADYKLYTECLNRYGKYLRQHPEPTLRPRPAAQPKPAPAPAPQPEPEPPVRGKHAAK